MKHIKPLHLFLYLIPFFIPQLLQAVCDCSDNTSHKVWFINNTNLSTGTGTYADPFQSFDAFRMVADSGNNCDVIYLFFGDGTSNGYNTGITLKPGQQLLGIGQAVFSECAGCGTPKLSNDMAFGFSPVITAMGNNKIEGLSIIDLVGDAGIQNGPFTSPGLEVTDCEFLSVVGGGGIALDIEPNLGTVSIMRCNFEGTAPLSPLPPGRTGGIRVFDSGNGDVTISNSTFTDNGFDYSYGILIDTAIGGPLNVSITRNRFDMNIGALSGIAIANAPNGAQIPFALSANVSDNNVILRSEPTPRDSAYGAFIFVQGLAVMPSSFGNVLCVSFNNNNATVAGNNNAIILLNGVTEPHAFLFDNNNANTGTIATFPNVNPADFTSPLFPIELTTDCGL